MAGASVFVELKMSLDEFKASMGEAKSEINKLEKHQGTTLDKVSAFGKGAMLGVAGAAVGIGGMAIEMADKQEIAQKQLEASLKASGTSWESVKDKVKQTGDEATKYGFTQEQIDSAMNLGVISTQNYGKAHDNLKVAIDLAAAKHVDLNTAMAAVDKAATGNTMALKKLGIDLPIVAGGAKAAAKAQDALSKAQNEMGSILAKSPDALNATSKAHGTYQAAVDKVAAAQKKLTSVHEAGNNVLDALKQRLSGQADAAADTFAGKLAAAKAQATNLGAEIGDKLMPVLSHLMGAVEKVVHWLEKHKTIAIALGVVIGGALAIAIGVYIVQQGVALAITVANGIAATVMGVAAAAAWLMALGPIGLLIIAVMAIIGIVILVITHWGEVSKFFKKMWGEITKLFSEAIHGVLDFFKKLPGEVVTVLGNIVETVFGALKTAGAWVSEHALKPVIKFFTDLPGKMLTAVGDIVGKVFKAFIKISEWFVTNVEIPVIKWFTALPGKAFTAIGDILKTIFKDFLKISEWFVTNVELPVIKWFTDLPGKAVTAIGDIVGTVFGALSGAWTWIKTNCYDPIVAGFKGLPGEIGSAVGGAISGIASIGTTIINEIITGLNLVIDTVDTAIGKISFFGVGLPKHLIPDIPKLAKGGPLDGGQMALVGENGPELFVPSGAGQIIPHGQFGAAGGRGGSGPVHITVQIAGHDVANVLLPSLQTTVLQAQRTSSVNIFGSAA